MTLNNGTTDRQTDSHAAAFGRIEGIEERLCALRFEAHARVLYTQADVILAFPLGPDDQPARPILDTAHRVRGVQAEVQDHLLKLDAIARHRRQSLIQVGMQNDLSPLEFANR